MLVVECFLPWQYVIDFTLHISFFRIFICNSSDDSTIFIFDIYSMVLKCVNSRYTHEFYKTYLY
jgi:hypothetical protein